LRFRNGKILPLTPSKGGIPESPLEGVRGRIKNNANPAKMTSNNKLTNFQNADSVIPIIFANPFYGV